ncbi:MAG: hypothetical protein EBV41_08220 [Actinobacteria bacterium]|nr:hypothetical protein [Actinomycetota bacterium]
MRQDLEPLFAPFTCGSLTTANRFVMSPLTRCRCIGNVPNDLVAVQRFVASATTAR